MLTVKILKRALLALALLTVGQAIPAHAGGEDDLKVARIRQDSPDSGYLFFDITIVIDGHPSCTALSAILISDAKKIAIAKFEVYRPNPLFSWASFSRGTMVPLQPATWTIKAVTCASGNREIDLNGAVVQIRMDRSEIINAGNLVLDVSVLKKGTFFTRPVVAGQAKIGEPSPDTVAAWRARAPETYAAAKRRTFTIAHP
jgi:hypothetical protein